MLTAIVGLPGAGKSYEAVVNSIVPALKQGRAVVTNIPLNRQHFLDTGIEFNVVPFTIDESTDFDSMIDEARQFDPKGLLFVIDEAWRLFPAGTNQSKIPVQYREFLAQNRHIAINGVSTETVFIVQDLSMISSFVRNLIDQTFICTKHNALGFKSLYRITIFSGGPTGHHPPKNRIIRTIQRKYDKLAFHYYRSHTKSDSSTADEKSVDDRGNVFRSPVIMIGIPVAILFVLFAAYYLFNFFQKPKAQIPKDTPVQVYAKSKPDPTPTRPEVTPTSSQWVITGFFSVRGKRTYLLTNSSGNTIRVESKDCRIATRTFCIAPDGLNAYEGRFVPVSNKLIP